jgi:hypothetical protein
VGSDDSDDSSKGWKSKPGTALGAVDETRAVDVSFLYSTSDQQPDEGVDHPTVATTFQLDWETVSFLLCTSLKLLSYSFFRYSSLIARNKKWRLLI